MEKGQLDPNIALPKFFALLEQKANQGWKGYTDTTRFQQNITNKRFEDQMMLFANAGGDRAFFNIWKTFADTLPQTNNLVIALAGAFERFARTVQGAGDIVVMLNDAVGQFQKLNPEVQDRLETLGAAFVLLGTCIGRAFLPLTAAYLILEDIATYRKGGKSITGLALGEDYSQTNNNAAPIGFALGNRFQDLPSGEALTRKWAAAQTGSDWDKAKYMFSLIAAKTSIPNLVGGVADMFSSPKTDSLDVMILS